MIGGMVETRIAMGFAGHLAAGLGCFRCVCCGSMKSFYFLHCDQDAPAHKLKGISLCSTPYISFQLLKLFLKLMDAVLLIWTRPFYCPKIQCMAATKVVLLSLYVFTSSFKDSSHWQTKIAVTFYYFLLTTTVMVSGAQRFSNV